ncbi:MAG: protein phosphatase 2C domain-containing protein [Polyangiaceae bacterium]
MLDISVISYALSDVGRRRTSNEDAFFVDSDLGLFVVADGMGGHAAGEIASSEAVDTIYGMIKRGLESVPELRGPVSEERVRAACRMMEGAIQAATYMLFAISELERDKHGMGTTISALLVLGDFAITGQVGDSRVYQVRDGVARQLTEDHTLIAWQLSQGLISEEEALRSPHKNVITRAVGNRDYVQVDTGVVDLIPGDRYLLCSDGLHGYLKENEIPSICTLPGDQAVMEFINLANRRGGRDNITAVLVEIEVADPLR